ncbi:hypothetical protein K443DRAFT_681725 [Laccaria amethystina LaAM-08-1]|uniref:Uncharacterized protein n=1 Tax=Laccaria amethystina LaAM-08-1 TaxID=1095629 RepID=A0A0C9XHL3_9AGAR|nr:hypothetical protein K443DRAFT_681725 [Laccaria amethystina LaAM-08-1]
MASGGVQRKGEQNEQENQNQNQNSETDGRSVSFGEMSVTRHRGVEYVVPQDKR